MRITNLHWGIFGLAGMMVIISLFLINTKVFFFLIGLGILTGISPFIYTLVSQNRIASEKERMFLEFTRNLVESVKTGTPVSRSIINVRNKSYGVLSENIKKLANQISLGIPLNVALQTFSKDVNNRTISRALTLIGQAERAGGDIGEILEAVAGAVSMSDKLKKERKAAISTLVAQGYIIFFIFIIIVLVMQFKILPMVSGLAGSDSLSGLGLSGGEAISPEDVSSPFIYLLLIQGLFSGLIIGKLSEGNVKTGIKHSFVLMLMSFLISSGASAFFG